MARSSSCLLRPRVSGRSNWARRLGRLSDPNTFLEVGRFRQGAGRRHDPGVRRRLVEWQREFASEYDVVSEGRDQGTIVFPDALRKFFLTASLEERARRRHAEFAARGEPIPVEAVRVDLRDRDDRDAARAIAPMKPAADASLIDTTGLSLDEVIGLIERDVRDRLERAGARPGQAVRP